MNDQNKHNSGAAKPSNTANAIPQIVWIVMGYDSLNDSVEIKNVFSTYDKAVKYAMDNNYKDPETVPDEWIVI